MAMHFPSAQASVQQALRVAAWSPRLMRLRNAHCGPVRRGDTLAGPYPATGDTRHRFAGRGRAQLRPNEARQVLVLRMRRAHLFKSRVPFPH